MRVSPTHLIRLAVGNSQAGLNAYQAPEDKSFCFYNGFDFNRVAVLKDGEMIKEKYNILPGSLVTGMVGAFYDRKDYTTYIQAAISYLETRQDMTFLAIGDGPNLQECKDQVPAKWKDRIIFTGMVDEVESLVNIFDIGVLSTYTEGISNSIMEYMVLGKPVIATDGGGTKELVLDKETGFLIPPKDPQALLEKLNFLSNSLELRTKLGVNGQLRIHQVFTLDRMELDYYNLYKKILSPDIEQEPITHQLHSSQNHPL